MDRKLRYECLVAVIEAAHKNQHHFGWDKVMDLPLKDIVEQLEETNTKSAEAAVQMFQDYANYLEDNEVARLESAAGRDPNP